MLVTIAEHRIGGENGNEVVQYGVMEGADLGTVDTSGIGIRVCETSEEVCKILEKLSKTYHTVITDRNQFNEICKKIWEGKKDSTQLELF